MSPPVECLSKVTFGLFEAHLRTGELWKAGKRIKIQSQPFKVLSALLERPGEIVSKEELQLRLWGKDTTVDFDHSLGTAINKIREALGDSADNPRFIETLARRGYRFIAPVGYAPSSSGESSRSTAALDISLVPADSFAIPTESFVNPLVVSNTPVFAESPQRSVRRTLVYIACGVLLLSAAVCIGFILRGLRPAAPPLRIVQITNNGRISPGAPTMEDLPSTATDGVHIFSPVIQDGRAILSQVSIADGTVLPLAVPSEIAAPSLGDLSPDGTKLLLRSHLSPESEQALWVVPVSGGSAWRVANILAHDATWMPDGNNILYAAGNDLFVTHLRDDSSALVAHLPGRAFWLRWSPDGRLLRFTILDPIGHTASLWELPLASHSPRPVLKGWSNPAAECCGSWTADGRSFVFQSGHDGNDDLWQLRGKELSPASKLTNGPLRYEAPITERSGHRIFFLGLDTRSELLRYSKERKEFLPENNFLAQANRVDFSRDGHWVAWTDAPGRLWRARLDGSEMLQLTPEPMQVFLAHWAPDGQHLAIMAREPGKAWQIYSIPSGGGSPQRLVDENRNAADPSWSADGMSIVFGRVPDLMGKESGPRAIQVLDLRTHALTVLPGSEGLFSPRWSPDGRYIAAISLDERKLMLFDLTRHTWSQLADSSVVDPVWSADSKAIYIHAFMEPSQPIYRVDVPGGRREQVADLAGLLSGDVADYFFSGITPDNVPLVRARTSTGNLYSLDLDGK
ncbi:MAG TPA: winged helix-turn-helix domain-containing protein [Granulicella sp.]|jgi:Tol biopolymer transport system component/DNA-binding winged helix-turn-helix (wHTH) protein|nr:winged helix-turn-helix domain-containing protein [Granulicella sp.]